MLRVFWLAVASSLAVGCGESTAADQCQPWIGAEPGLGASIDEAGCLLSLRVASVHASRVEAWLYDSPVDGELLQRVELKRDSDGDVWSAQIAIAELGVDAAEPLYYGYRAWGPNWDFEPDWRPGRSLGVREDVDGEGNRFNPNKLLIDPYALELSHDPSRDHELFATGSDYRAIDTGPFASKGVIFTPSSTPVWTRPSRDFKDEIVYEVHVRGLTMSDPSIEEGLRGTYAGAALKAGYLRELGVTAIELLPVHETENDLNDAVASTDGDNYWGYASLSFMAPERRYAADKSPGGPTREFRDMVAAFHDEGIKVYIDVVYNHTAETPLWDADGRVATLYSWRGLDSASYYQLDRSGRGFRNDNGVGPNVNVTHPLAANLIVDSLSYWHHHMGVDGFRFDLASVLGNTCDSVCFSFDASGDSLLARIGDELAGADLIAEPWSTSSYQLGEFLDPWVEWNDGFRDGVRRHLNRFGVEEMSPRQLADRWAGSASQFADDGRKPWHSLNFVVAHDGFTLADLFSCSGKQNDQPWPYGPSPGGSDYNLSWDHDGNASLQRQAARTAMALLLLAPGVPMFTGGDEFLRSQSCNNNPFNLDAETNWLAWQDVAPTGQAFSDYTAAMLAFRADHEAFRPAEYWSYVDGDGNSRADAAWIDDAGEVASDAYLDDTAKRFLGLVLDGAELGDDAAAIYVGYNGGPAAVEVALPQPPPGTAWSLVVDTAATRETSGNVLENPELLGVTYSVAARAVIVALAE